MQYLGRPVDVGKAGSELILLESGEQIVESGTPD
jgi:hypothetical protein